MRHLAKAATALLVSLALGLLVGAPAATLADGATPDGPGFCCRS